MNKKLEHTIFELSHSTCKTAFFISFPDNLSWQQVHVLWVGNLHFALHLIFPLTFLHPPWSLASSLQLSYSTQKKVEEPKANFFSSQTCFANMQYLGEEIRGDPRFPKQKYPTILSMLNTSFSPPCLFYISRLLQSYADYLRCAFHRNHVEGGEVLCKLLKKNKTEPAYIISNQSFMNDMKLCTGLCNKNIKHSRKKK